MDSSGLVYGQVVGYPCVRKWIIGFHTWRKISWLIKLLSASQEWLCIMPSVVYPRLIFIFKKMCKFLSMTPWLNVILHATDILLTVCVSHAGCEYLLLPHVTMPFLLDGLHMLSHHLNCIPCFWTGLYVGREEKWETWQEVAGQWLHMRFGRKRSRSTATKIPL
jgi:hypothetical protein